MASGDDAGILPAPDVLPGRSPARAAPPRSARPRPAPGCERRRLAGELHRVGADARRRPSGVGDREEEAVRLHLRIVGQIERRLQRSPDALGGAQHVLPVRRAAGSRRARPARRGWRRPARGARRPSDSARAGPGWPTVAAKSGQKRSAWSIMQDQPLAVGAEVRCRRAGSGRSACRPPTGSMKPYMSAAVMSGESTHMAVPRSETSTSMPWPVRSRWKSAAAMPPAIAIPPMKSPNAGRCWSGGCPVVDRRSAMPPRAQNETPSYPPRRASGPRRALARAARVDQARVDRAQIVPGETQALARVVEEAGEEDVGAGRAADRAARGPRAGRGRCRRCACCVPGARRRSSAPTRRG